MFKQFVIGCSLMVAFSSASYAYDPLKVSPRTRVCIAKRCFDTKLAHTSYQRARGLMYKVYLPRNEAMLFVFERPGKHTFWMKNTYIPLDILWIDENRRIVDIQHSAQPCYYGACDQYSPKARATYVLEISGGLAKRYRFKVGQKVSFRLRLKKATAIQ